MVRKKFVFYKQQEAKDCGPTCLRMVAKHFGRTISLTKLRSLSETTREGSSLIGLYEAAEKVGLKVLGVKLDFLKFRMEAPLPSILHWENNHFIVVYKITKRKVFVADPAIGLLTYTPEDFIEKWIGSNSSMHTQEGVALLFEPTPAFYQQPEDKEVQSYSWALLGAYLSRYRLFFIQLIIGLIAASLLQLLFPFLTQSIVDVGIKNQDIGFVYLVLVAQLFLFIGRTSIEAIRAWILLHLSTRINVSLVSDFFIKLMRLPISYFDTRLTGDLMQRINDHRRIEEFLTNSSLSSLFSMVNLVVFAIVLGWYHLTIFMIFLAGFGLYFIWLLLFLKKRRILDFKRFSQVSNEQSKVIEMISGMQEIKLHNAERQKRWSWEYVQARLFKLEIKSLRIEQTQTIGLSFINELKNILITVFAAALVIQGQLTLGMMLSISYIIGQLNGPIQQLVSFTHSLQDARIAFERLAEIHEMENEEVEGDPKIHHINLEADIIIDQLSFRYTGTEDPVIKNISFVIPTKKVTAIVGASGSGKTTLMKLLLKFYEPLSGSIFLGNTRLSTISQQSWRAKLGVVMQEGYIFNDTIAGNIALGVEEIDYQRLLQAVEVANLRDFIESLPHSFNTRIGMEGVGMSTGQKQRLLIARAVYKNPDFIFFDEATSALDARNERVIMDNLQQFNLGKTAVIIAHRLSTVKHADQIVVMNDGEITEIGNHHSLIAKRGAYYNLIKNQLELDKLTEEAEEVANV